MNKDDHLFGKEVNYIRAFAKSEEEYKDRNSSIKGN